MISKGESLALIILLVAGYVAYASIPSFVPPVEWTAKYGGAGGEIASFIEPTSDGGYIIVGGAPPPYHGVSTYDDVWLVKTDSMGKMQWNKTYGGRWDDYGSCVRQTTDGGYIVAASTNSSGAGKADFWLIKTDPDGNMQWNRTYGGPNEDWATFVQETSDGGYIVIGTTLSFGAGLGVFWLIKTDRSGVMQWNKTYGGPESEWANSIHQTLDGGYFVAGRLLRQDTYRTDFFLVKTDPSGNMQWNRTYGGSEDDDLHAAQQTSDGGYIAFGMTFSYGAGQGDYLLVKMDSNGNLQ